MLLGSCASLVIHNLGPFLESDIENIVIEQQQMVEPLTY